MRILDLRGRVHNDWWYWCGERSTFRISAAREITAQSRKSKDEEGEASEMLGSFELAARHHVYATVINTDRWLEPSCWDGPVVSITCFYLLLIWSQVSVGPAKIKWRYESLSFIMPCISTCSYCWAINAGEIMYESYVKNSHAMLYGTSFVTGRIKPVLKICDEFYIRPALLHLFCVLKYKSSIKTWVGTK